VRAAEGEVDMSRAQKIVPCLWFDGNAEDAAAFYVSLFEGSAITLYTSIFPDSPVDGILRYGPGEPGKEGTVKHAQFALSGGKFMVMDGPGEHAFGFNEAVSFMITCETQAEIDQYWARLTAGGGAESMCGWLKDPFGVSWQVVPAGWREILSGPNGAAAGRALLGMRKLDLDALRAAR